MVKAIYEDLGYIKVRSVDHVDTIYLGHNDARIATVSCQNGKPVSVHVHPAFLRETTYKWKQVFDVYTAWKRAVTPHLKLPDFADVGRPQGHTSKSGKEHPWRGHRPVKVKKTKPTEPSP